METNQVCIPASLVVVFDYVYCLNANYTFGYEVLAMTDTLTAAEHEPHIHILHTPMKEVAAFSMGEKYCFHCRKRRLFIQVVEMVCDRTKRRRLAMSYYGPYRHIECVTCGTHDSDCFPGTCWEYRFDD